MANYIITKLHPSLKKMLSQSLLKLMASLNPHEQTQSVWGNNEFATNLRIIRDC